MNRHRVLIVDDDPATLEVLTVILRRTLKDLQVEGTHSPMIALERVQTTQYDAVLTDLRMPGMDGLQLASHIHAIQPNTPVILITGAVDVQPPSGNIFAWLPKPLDIDALLTTLEDALG